MRQPSNQEPNSQNNGGILTPVEIVAKAILSVNKVATDILSVITVANNEETVKDVSLNMNSIVAVADIKQAITMLSSNLSNVDLVANHLGQVGNVSNNMATLLLLHGKMNQILRLENHLDGLNEIILNMDNLEEVREAIPDIATLLSHMVDIIKVAGSVDNIVEVFDNLDSLLLLSQNIDAVNILNENMDIIIASTIYVEQIEEKLKKIELVEENVIALETSVTASKDVAVTKAEEANLSALDAGLSKQAAKMSEDNAKESENLSKENADKTSEDRTVIEGLAQTVAYQSQQVAFDAEKVSTDKDLVSNDRHEVANLTSTVNTKHADVVAKHAEVATNTTVVSQKTQLAQAAAATATDKAASAATHDANAQDAATRAEQSAQTMTGAVVDGGKCNLASGVYPTPIVIGGEARSTVWYVEVGGIVDGITFDAGDVLRYTVHDTSYFKIDAVDTTTAQINAHEAKVNAHSISGVSGLRSELDSRPTHEVANSIASSITEAGVTAHETKNNAHSISNITGLEEILASKANSSDLGTAASRNVMASFTDTETPNALMPRGAFGLGAGMSVLSSGGYDEIMSRPTQLISVFDNTELQGTRHVIHLTNPTGNIQADLALRGNGVDFSWRGVINGEKSPWRDVYHTGNKPTANDVGAVPTMGNAQKEGNLAVIGSIATSLGFRATASWSENNGNSFMMKVGTYNSTLGDVLEIRPAGGSASNKTAGFDIYTTRNNSRTNLFEKGQRVYSPNNKPNNEDVGLPAVTQEEAEGTSSALRAWSSLRVRQAIEAWTRTQNDEVGVVKFFISTVTPSGRYIKANGAALSRTAYSDLFAKVGTFWGDGDGSTTFNVPDLRGEFIRSWDDGRGVDAGRTFGSEQGDASRKIEGQIAHSFGRGGFGVDSGAFYHSGTFLGERVNTVVSGTNDLIKFDSSRVVPTAGENRPRNMALIAWIRY